MTFECAKHNAVISLAAMRKLHFPLDGETDARPGAPLLFAALGLFALAEIRRSDRELRSRWVLVFDAESPDRPNPRMEIVRRDGTPKPFSLDSLDEEGAGSLLTNAIGQATAMNLRWGYEPITSTPRIALQCLIIQVWRLRSVKADGEEEAERGDGSQGMSVGD